MYESLVSLGRKLASAIRPINFGAGLLLTTRRIDVAVTVFL